MKKEMLSVVAKGLNEGGIIMKSLVKGVLGVIGFMLLMLLPVFVETADSERINKVLGMMVVITFALAVFVFLGVYNKKKSQRITIFAVRQLFEDDTWRLYSVQFNGLRKVVSYELSYGPATDSEEELWALEPLSVSLEQAEALAKRGLRQ